MIIKPMVRVEAQFVVDDREAEILSHLCGYELSEWFVRQCSGQYTAAGIRDVLKRIGRLASTVVIARQKAAEVILAQARTLSPDQK